MIAVQLGEVQGVRQQTPTSTGAGVGVSGVVSRRHPLLSVWVLCFLFGSLQFVLFRGQSITITNSITTITTTIAVASSSTTTNDTSGVLASSRRGGEQQALPTPTTVASTPDSNTTTLHSRSSSLLSSISQPPPLPKQDHQQEQEEESSLPPPPPPPPPPKEQQQKQGIVNKPYLSYDLYMDRPYKMMYSPWTQCRLGKEQRKGGKGPIYRAPLANSFHSIVNVTTYIRTNMKILMLGDSVGIQFYELLAEAMGTKSQDMVHKIYAWGLHESVSIAAPVQGGGVVGGYRITGMFLKRGLGKKPPNSGGGGWNMEYVNSLLHHSYNKNDTDTTTDITTTITSPMSKDDNGDNTTMTRPLTSKSQNITSAVSPTSHQNQNTTVQQFDSMIFRIPHGWLSFDEITRETLVETLELSHAIFGVKTIIIMTLPVNNNVLSLKDLEKLQQTNLMIRDVVDHWPEYVTNSTTTPASDGGDGTGTGGLEHVLLMDFGRWAMELVELNAKSVLGWEDISTTTTAESMSKARVMPENYTIEYNYTLSRLDPKCHKNYAPSIAMVCVNMTRKEADIGETCECVQRNRISIDGLHWCMESVGGRSVAAMSCLLQCPLQLEAEGKETIFTTTGTLVIDPALRACEQRCNDRFMSMTPVEELLLESPSPSYQEQT